MLKKHKKIVAPLFLASLIFVTIYGNYHFLKDQIFAEMTEESVTTESSQTSSGERSSQDSSEEKNSSIELEEEAAQPQQDEKITRGVLDDGWEAGTANDFIEHQGNKISWNNGGSWWYTRNGSSWISKNTIEATLIVNGRFLENTSENVKGGFLWGTTASNVMYFMNSSTNTLKKRFMHERYQIEISQQLLEDGTAEISYQVTNINFPAQKIGVSQYIFINNNLPVRALDDFKGMSMSYGDSDQMLTIIPDSETMPNWSGVRGTMLQNFSGYSPRTVDGVGWESGKQQPSSSVDLNVHQPINLGSPGVVMKNPGVLVNRGESAIFKQTVRLGESLPPLLTVDQKTHTMYTTDSFDITGTISDRNNAKYRLYLEMDDSKKTLVSLKEFKNVPLQEVQNYQATIEGKNFTEGNHTVSIIGIDEFGARSEEQKITFTIKKIGATPLIQKVKKGENIQKEMSKLFENVTGDGVTLKTVSDVDSSTVGFRWVDATLVDGELKEASFKIPVTIYDSTTTIFNDADNIALDVNNTVVTIDEVTSAINGNRLNELIIEKSGADSWQLEDGQKTTLTVLKHTISQKVGSYTVDIRATRVGTTKVLDKRIDIIVAADSLEEGWEYTNESASISTNGYRLNWLGGAWWYTHQGSSWLYSNSIEAALIINGSFFETSSDMKGNGFLQSYAKSSIYSIQAEAKSLRRTFTYLDKYTIEITQQLLDNYAVEVTYKVTNRTGTTQKVGISQYADTMVGVDTVPVVPINNFKGLNLTYGESALAIIPDEETMPNWAAGNYPYVPNFVQYSVQNADGIGWESGKRYRNNYGNLIGSPQVLKENQPVSLGDSGVSMKNPGVTVANNESTSFKQLLKYGAFSAPVVTLNQSKASVYQDEKLLMGGTIVDEDNLNYRLYMEMDDKDKTLILLEDYKNIPYREIQTFQTTIEGSMFSPGIHEVSIIGIDEYGARSIPQKLTLTVGELSGEPKIHTLKLGESISNDINVLFNEVKGVDVKLKKPLLIDSSVVGFQWVEAILTDGTRDIVKKIPVSVYNSESTIFNETDNIALDAKDSDFELVDVRQSNEENTLDELVRQKVKPKAWDMADGTEFPVEIITNSIKPALGNYRATFKVTTGDTGKNLQKISELSVGGELKFKDVPENLDYKTTKLSQKTPYVGRAESDWKIELENTIGSNWSLFASAVPFKDKTQEKLKSLLVFKAGQMQDLVIDGISQKIAMGSETFPTVQWSETAGLLLKVNPDAKIGSYQGEITWLLSDAP